MENTISLVYGITSHRKGKVDHVGDLAKVTTTREIAANKLLAKWSMLHVLDTTLNFVVGFDMSIDLPSRFCVIPTSG